MGQAIILKNNSPFFCLRPKLDLLPQITYLDYLLPSNNSQIGG